MNIRWASMFVLHICIAVNESIEHEISLRSKATLANQSSFQCSWRMKMLLLLFGSKTNLLLTALFTANFKRNMATDLDHDQ